MSESTSTNQTKGKLKREDPPPRPIDGLVSRGMLENGDPSKHYVWVSDVNDPTFNIGHYRRLGYKVAQYDPDSAQPLFGFEERELKQGDPVRSTGMVLMECPIEHKRQLDQAGWQKANQIEETIRRHDIDPYSREERAMFKGITSVRDPENDDRARWKF